MKEVFTMWRHTKMIVLVALCAAMYAALLIPFQSIPLIPGHVSLRVANILPVAFGLLFGPAGAFGCAIGNLIGDFFGTLSPGALGGFVANFMLAFLSYKLWSALSPLRDIAIRLDSLRQMVRYEMNVFLQTCSITLILTFWVSLLLGLVPAEFYFIAVLAGSFIPAAVVTPFIIRIIYPRLKKWGLLWTDIMAPEEVSSGRRFRKVGLALVSIGAVGGLVSMLFFLYIADASTGSALVIYQPVPFLILIFAGSVMMGGRDQVEAMQGQFAPDGADRSTGTGRKPRPEAEW